MISESEELGSIVCEAMRGSEQDEMGVCLRGYDIDCVNLSESCFVVFAPLDKLSAMTARGKIDTYGFMIQQARGKRYLSRIVFFSQEAEVSSLPLFEEILAEWQRGSFGFGLSEAMLVLVSEVDFELGDARVVVVARRALKV